MELELVCPILRSLDRPEAEFDEVSVSTPTSACAQASGQIQQVSEVTSIGGVLTGPTVAQMLLRPSNKVLLDDMASMPAERFWRAAALSLASLPTVIALCRAPGRYGLTSAADLLRTCLVSTLRSAPLCVTVSCLNRSDRLTLVGALVVLSTRG